MLNKRHQNFINNIQTNNKIIKSGKSKQNLLKTKDVLAIFDDESDDLFITQDPEFLEQKKLFKEIEENKTITRNTQKNYLSKLVNKKKVKLTKENSFIDEKSPKNYTNNLNNKVFEEEEEINTKAKLKQVDENNNKDNSKKNANPEM